MTMVRMHVIQVTVPVKGALPFLAHRIRKNLEAWIKDSAEKAQQDSKLVSFELDDSLVQRGSQYHKPGKTIEVIFEAKGEEKQVLMFMQSIKTRLVNLSINHRQVSEHGEVKKHISDRYYATCAAIIV